MGNDASVTAPGLLGKPEQVIQSHPQFAQALRQRLAGFQRHGAGDLVAPAFEFMGDFAEELAAGFARQRAPARKGRVGVLNRFFQARAVHGGHFGDDLSGGGVADGKMPVGRDKLAIEIKRMDFHYISELLLMLIVFLILIGISSRMNEEDCHQAYKKKSAAASPKN